MIATKGNTWLEDAVQPGGYLDNTAGCEDSFHYVHQAIYKLGTEYTHDSAYNPTNSWILGKSICNKTICSIRKYIAKYFS